MGDDGEGTCFDEDGNRYGLNDDVGGNAGDAHA